MPSQPSLSQPSLSQPIVIRHETQSDTKTISRFTARIIGAARSQRPSYRFRDGIAHQRTVSLVAYEGDRLVGSVRFWHIGIGTEVQPEMLLGPLVVEPELRGLGIGVTLMQHGIEAITENRYNLVLLVGDLDYYQRFGFTIATRGRFIFPQPHDPNRLLVNDLNPARSASLCGLIRSISI